MMDMTPPSSLCCISLSLCPVQLWALTAMPWALCPSLLAARSSLHSFCPAGGIPSYHSFRIMKLPHTCVLIHCIAPFTPKKYTGQDHPCVNSNRKIQIIEVSVLLNELPRPAPTVYQTLGGLRQQKCTVSQFRWPEVGNQGVGSAIIPLKPVRESLSSSSSFWWWPSIFAIS